MIAVSHARIRLDLWETVLLLAFVAMIAALVTQQHYLAPSQEAGYLLRLYEDRYGSKVSQFAEEWLIRDFFHDKRNGVFVDVGANSYKENSTTYSLEIVLGWSGVAVEPQAQYAPNYRRFRPRTKFVQAFVSDRPGVTTLYVPGAAPGIASSHGHAGSHPGRGGSAHD